jgi:hypothetical protein
MVGGKNCYRTEVSTKTATYERIKAEICYLEITGKAPLDLPKFRRRNMRSADGGIGLQA